MKDILNKVLEEIKPSEKEEKETIGRINKVMDKVQKALPECKVILGGSGEKGTWLSRAHDADIFVKFPKKEYGRKSYELSDVVEKRLNRLFRLIRLHGSRDYFQIIDRGFTFEIVPILDIKKAEEAINITDISPLHAVWVKKHKEYADDIRLTKQFFKAARVYGAESYIKGFSGYMCEILTIYYKGFENLIKAIAKWKPRVIIDAEAYYKGKDLLFEMDKAKTQGPLVIVDPVQKERNAAAALSREKFERIIEYSKEFLSKPSKDFFSARKIDITKLKINAGGEDFFVLDVKPKEGKKDTVGCKLLKSFEYITKELKSNEFHILFSDWEWNGKAEFYFIIKKVTLPATRIVKGPPERIKYYASQFRKKHKDVFIKGKNLFANERREFRQAKSLLKEIIKDKYIKEKVEKIYMR